MTVGFSQSALQSTLVLFHVIACSCTHGTGSWGQQACLKRASCYAVLHLLML